MRILTLLILFLSNNLLAQDSYNISRRVQEDVQSRDRILNGEENIDYGNLVSDSTAYDSLANAAGSGWNWATNQMCGSTVPETIAAINECSEVYTIRNFVAEGDLSNIHNIEEELIYLSAAERTHQFSRCQRLLYDGLPQVMPSYERQLVEQFREIQTRIRGEQSGISRRSTEVRRRIQRTGPSSDASFDRDNQLIAADAEVTRGRERINALISRIPLGNRPEVKAAIMPFVERDNVNPAELLNAYRTAIQGMNTNNRTSMCYFEGGAGCPREMVGPNGTVSIPARGIVRRSPNGQVYYVVDENFKRDLRDSGQIENVIRGTSMPDRLKDAFMCRQNQRYGVGATVLEIGQIPLYFVGAYGLSRLAARAGVQAIRATSALGRATASATRITARLGILGMEATDLAYIPSDLQQSCFRNQIELGTFNGSCTLESELAQVAAESSTAECLTTVAVSAAGGIAAVGGAGAATRGGRIAVDARERGRVWDRLRRDGITEELTSSNNFRIDSGVSARLDSEQRITIINGMTSAHIRASDERALRRLSDFSEGAGVPPRLIERRNELKRILTGTEIPDDEIDEVVERLLESGVVGRPPARAATTTSTPTPNRVTPDSTRNQGIVIGNSADNVRPVRPDTNVTPTSSRTGNDLPTGNGSQTVRPGSAGVSDDIRGPQLEAQKDRIFREFAGDEPSFRDQEIILDILSGGPRRATYQTERNADISEDFWQRYLDIERRIEASPNKARYRREFDELTEMRIRNGNRATDEEIETIRRTERNSDVQDIECEAMASVYPGSFPRTGGRCKRVTFTEESRGNFCSCGNRGSSSVNWLIRCPTSAAQFRTITSYVDELALPHASAPEMCARVDIPAGRQCYVGPTSATFAGFGGTSQMLCFNGRSSRAPAVAARDRYNLDMPADAAQHVRPTRWSPFATQPEYADFIQRITNRCSTRCDDIAGVRREFAEISQRIQARVTSPADIARFRQEQEMFALYLDDLQFGRNPLPSVSQRRNNLPQRPNP